MRRRTLLAAPLLLPVAAAAATPLVVVSFSILGDLVRQVAGERVTVRALVGPDADAHEYQPRPSDAAAVRDATLVVRNGLGFEPWLDRLLRAAGPERATVTAARDVTPRQVGSGAVDPHAWGDVGNAVRYLAPIAEGLAAADPGGAVAYMAAAAGAAARLRELDGWVRAQVASVPEERRVVVTTHDAFEYLGAAYGIRFLAPLGISTEAEPSAAALGRLIRQVRSEHVTAVFIENMSSPTLLDRLAAEAGVRVRGRLYSDALSRPDGPAPTYEALLRHNVGLLVPAMRGDAAP